MLKAAVLGWPIEHSKSPELHRYWLERYGIEGQYEAIGVEPGRLEETLRQLQKEGYSGVNLTIPHKEAALEMVDRLSATARRIGAVNTVTMHADGTLEGSNTDAYGFVAHLQEAAPALYRGKAVILGAGGAARAALAALMDEGWQEIVVCNRTRIKAQELVEYFSPAAVNIRLDVADWPERSEALGGANLLINATSLGMGDRRLLKIRLREMQERAAVYDLVYNPLETALLRQAKRENLTAIDGLGMLIHQAVPAFEKFYGKRPLETRELYDKVAAELSTPGKGRGRRGR